MICPTHLGDEEMHSVTYVWKVAHNKPQRKARGAFVDWSCFSFTNFIFPSKVEQFSTN